MDSICVPKIEIKTQCMHNASDYHRSWTEVMKNESMERLTLLSNFVCNQKGHLRQWPSEKHSISICLTIRDSNHRTDRNLFTFEWVGSFCWPQQLCIKMKASNIVRTVL